MDCEFLLPQNDHDMNIQSMTKSATLAGISYAALAFGYSALSPSVPLVAHGDDGDWILHGNGDLQAHGAGNVSIGGLPAGDVKLAVVGDSPLIKVAGSFYKIAVPGQIGGSVGLQGLCRDQEGGGIGVKAQAWSDSPTSGNVGLASLAFGDSNANYGITSQAYGDPEALCVGVQTVASASKTSVQYGVFSVSGLSTNEVAANYAGRFIGYGSDTAENSNNYAFHATANPGLETNTNVAVYALAQRPPSGIPGNPTFNVGVYAYSDKDGSFNRAAYLNGDVEVTGAVYLTSDERLKDDIRPAADGALALLQGLETQAYSYRQDIPEMSLPEGEQRGFIAQDLERIFPGLVAESVRPAVRDEDGIEIWPALEYKSVNYIGLIPVLTQAVQEQQEEISGLRDELEQVKADTQAMRKILVALQAKLDE